MSAKNLSKKFASKAVAWWRRNAPANLWEWLSLLAIFGAAVTTNLVVDFATSTSWELILFTGLAAIFIALMLVVGLRKGGWWLVILVVLSLVSATMSWFSLQAFIANPNSPDISVPCGLAVSTIATVVLAGGAAWAFGVNKEKLLNPKITATNNGVTLVGVLASAFTFNLPEPLGQVIGWPVILITLFTMWPVFKNGVATPENGTDTASKNQTDANKDAAAALKKETEANKDAAAALKNETEANKLKFMAAALTVIAPALSLLLVAVIRKVVNKK